MSSNILIISDDIIFTHMIELELTELGYTVVKIEIPIYDFTTVNIENLQLLIVDLSLYENISDNKEILFSKVSIPVICFDYNILNSESFNNQITFYLRPFSIKKLRENIMFKISPTEKKDVQSKMIDSCVSEELKISNCSNDVTYANEKIHLTKKEFDLLLYFVKNKGRKITREQALHEVWRYGIYDTNVVDVYVRYLRAKLDEHFNVKFIYTVRGIGYMFK